ncbi:MAG TPA: GNAT family N-acetyltransferase, partial [Solirubrobacterales bacterium]|nr:GNAT family N-acetyltransferase [Solirubrobacterales bacterium]
PDPDRPVLARYGAGNVLVALVDSEVVGSLLLGPWTELESSRHVLEVKGLAVDPARQGRGVGTALVDAAIARARERGARRLVLRVLSSNDAARRLYASRGFEVEGGRREAFLLEGAYVDDLMMGIDLIRVTTVGIDVGGRRKGFHGCALRGGEIVAGPERLPDVASAVAWVTALAPAVVALDSPRECAPDGESSRADERELNRAVCGIRWTPERSRLAGNPYYEWVEHGLELYAALAGAGIDAGRLIEVFPTAAWTIWAGPREGRPRGEWSADALADLGLAGLPSRRLSQDDRDAVAAALVARLHGEGRSRAFGAIIVPDGDLAPGRSRSPARARPAAPRRARTSQAPPAAGPGRPRRARPE